LTRYLLDTNIISDLVRNPQGRVAGRIADVGEANICTSIIVAAELRFGATKRGSARLTTQIETIIDHFDVLPFDSPADIVYGALRHRLEAAGTPIGGNDLLIAAHALALGHLVVTDNEREFRRVPNLQVENWLRED